MLFDKDCSASGCPNGELLTSKLTTGWSNVREYESSTSLNNTIADCRQCHAPDDSQAQLLRMQEIAPPFTHWFSMQTTGGQALYQDFHKAHPAGEDYGPIPSALVDKADPALMAQMITQAGFGDQPNPFDSKAIEAEVATSAPMQPAMNAPMGASTTWTALYEKAVAGQFIATPYHDVKITDPSKLTSMSAAYTKFMSGGATALPDIRDVFYDAGLRDMGFAPKKGLTGRELVTQMCQECHNSKLDLTISRENFLVDTLDSMSRMEKDLAIHAHPDDASTRACRCRPRLFRTITDDERQRDDRRAHEVTAANTTRARESAASRSPPSPARTRRTASARVRIAALHLRPARGLRPDRHPAARTLLRGREIDLRGRVSRPAALRRRRGYVTYARLRAAGRFGQRSVAVGELIADLICR